MKKRGNYRKYGNKPYKKQKFTRKPKDEIYKRDKKNDEFIRLNKFIANSGVCSRREADELIKSGKITVNGEVVKELGTKIKPGDEVIYNGKRLKGEKNVYIVMNKPKNYITTTDDPKHRKTVMDLFQGKVKERIYPVGRLDRNTTGVLLFTNDGELAKKLTHPSSNIPKVYVVTLDKPVTKSYMNQLVDGIELEDGVAAADAVYYFAPNRQDKVVLEIHSGRNRVIRRMFEHMNFEVKNLDRIEFAGITKKDLKRGQWRYLSEKEVGFLMMLAGKQKFK